MEKRLVSLFILFIFLCNAANAQHDFQPGYIVTNTNDTIQGFIDYGISRSNSVSCNFKKDSNGVVTPYSPNELKAYAFSGRNQYITKSIKTETGFTNFFLEYLVTGVLNLYYYNDMGIEHYLVEQANTLYELKNDEVSFVDGGKTYYKRSNQYKGALAYLMKDVPGMAVEIQKTDFNTQSLIKLMEKYHKMSGRENYVVYWKQEKKANDAKWKFSFGISAGFNYSVIKTSSASEAKSYVFAMNTLPPQFVSIDAYVVESNIAGLTNAPTLSASSITVVPDIALNIHRNNKNSLQIEFLYIKNKYEAKGFTIKTDNLVVPVLYKREFNYYKKLKPFVDFGSSLRYESNLQIDNMYLKVATPEMSGNQFDFTIAIKFISIKH
jgi:hypothetical protein